LIINCFLELCRVLILGMHWHVSLQIARLGEALLADMTLVWLLARVRSLVLLQRGRVVEAVVTVTTPVGLLVRVSSQVNHGVRLIIKHLIFKISIKLLVMKFKYSKKSSKKLTTNGTLVRFAIAVMLILVHQPLGHVLKFERTVAASDRLNF
jgi:hypothetical protein